MKKFVAILSAALTVLSLTACEGSKNPSSDETTLPAEAENTEISISLADGINPGTTDGNRFVNESTGIKFTKPDSWIFSSDEDIAGMMNIGAAHLDRDIFEKALAEMSTVYDMVAVDPDTSASVTVAYENISFSEKDISTEEKYLESIKEQILSTSMEFTFEDKIKSERLGSYTYKKLESTNTTSGYSIQQTIYARVIGDYMCTIVISNIAKGQLSKIEAMFS